MKTMHHCFFFLKSHDNGLVIFHSLIIEALKIMFCLFWSREVCVSRVTSPCSKIIHYFSSVLRCLSFHDLTLCFEIHRGWVSSAFVIILHLHIHFVRNKGCLMMYGVSSITEMVQKIQCDHKVLLQLRKKKNIVSYKLDRNINILALRRAILSTDCYTHRCQNGVCDGEKSAYFVVSQWAERDGPISWPLRSSDIIPLDFCIVRSRNLVQQIHDTESLKVTMTVAISDGD